MFEATAKIVAVRSSRLLHSPAGFVSERRIVTRPVINHQKLCAFYDNASRPKRTEVIAQQTDIY